MAPLSLWVHCFKDSWVMFRHLMSHKTQSYGKLDYTFKGINDINIKHIGYNVTRLFCSPD